MRFLILFFLPAVLVVAACGDDDTASTATGSSTPSSSGNVSATETSSPANDSESGTPTTVPTPQAKVVVTPTPTRRDVAYGHYGENTTDIIGHLANTVGTGVPIAVPCPYDAVDVVVNCTDQGYGRIALDIKPTAEVTECRALTTPGGELIAASCNTVAAAGWFYKIVE